MLRQGRIDDQSILCKTQHVLVWKIWKCRCCCYRLFPLKSECYITKCCYFLWKYKIRYHWKFISHLHCHRTVNNTLDENFHYFQKNSGTMAGQKASCRLYHTLYASCRFAVHLSASPPTQNIYSFSYMIPNSNLKVSDANFYIFLTKLKMSLSEVLYAA